MRRSLFLYTYTAALAGALVLGCGERPGVTEPAPGTAPSLAATVDRFEPTAQSDSPTMQASVGSRVVHRVSAGGPDVCSGAGDKPGCDANFSLIALQRADGSVTGQWVDRVSQVNGGGGTHVAINCLNVIDNRGYVSGVVTQGNSDQVGQRALAKVVDNGRTAHDPPDQLSPTIIFPGVVDCNGAPAFDDVIPLHAAPEGQVVVQ